MQAFFSPEAKNEPVVFSGDNQDCEALGVAELVMVTLFKRRYAHLYSESVRTDARHLQETLQRALAA
jgi:hypothetical protein